MKSMSWNFLGLWLAVWPSWVPWNMEIASDISVWTFQVQIQCPQPSLEARTVEMWVDGRALFHRSPGAEMPISRTRALTAPTMLTSALLRDVLDFGHCEISPYSEDTHVWICIRSTREAMFYAIKTFSERRGECWHSMMCTWEFVTQLSLLCAGFENFHDKKINV